MDHYASATRVYRSARARLYEQVKKFRRLRQALPLIINKLDGLHNIVRVGEFEFVILRNVLDMRQSLVYEDFAEHGFVLKHVNPVRLLDIGCNIGPRAFFLLQTIVNL